MVALAGRGWTLAPSLEAMWREANRIAPRRSTASDGSIGDQSHANRASMHNPQGGVVHALDLTHSPDRGFDAHARARTVAAGRDPRCRLIISNGRIWIRARAREGWRIYSGANPHRTHAHFEVETTNAARRDTSAWFSAVAPFPTPPPPPKPQPAPEPVPQLEPEDDDDMALTIRLNQSGHKHHGRIETVTAMHRRWVTPDELALHNFLGGKIVSCNRVQYNQWTANKQAIGTNPINGPI